MKQFDVIPDGFENYVKAYQTFIDVMKLIEQKIKDHDIETDLELLRESSFSNYQEELKKQEINHPFIQETLIYLDKCLESHLFTLKVLSFVFKDLFSVQTEYATYNRRNNYHTEPLLKVLEL